MDVPDHDIAARRAFDAMPSTVPRPAGHRHAGATCITLCLPSRGQPGWDSLHGFLAPRAIPGLESSAGGRFRRNLPGGWVELGSAPPAGEQSPADDRARPPTGLTVSCSLQEWSDLAGVLAMVRRVTDLDSDLAMVEEHLAQDPDLAARLPNTPVPRLPGAFDRFEIAVRAVIGQQVSVAAARTMLGRLVTLASPEPGARFPPAEVLATTPRLDELGMPGRRRETLRALARAVAAGQVVLGPQAEPDETRRQLLAIDGIGPWTAGYIAMRALGDPDAWPTGDLGLRRSLGVPAAELEARAESWRPWRAYAALLLWQSDPTHGRQPAHGTPTGSDEPPRPDRRRAAAGDPR
jgi:AraC family transcriptional regulator of adaptative response / DNA-3-methyladenine glycosylase II